MENLVSFCIPVKNGMGNIERLIDSIFKQSYQNFEIIISDNNSDDDTAAICEKYQAEDDRVRYVRHNQTLSAADNFRFVFDQAGSEYFMWAAHDDRHSLNYVETLVGKLKNEQMASLVFSGVAIFHQTEKWHSTECKSYQLKSDEKCGFWNGLLVRDYIHSGYLHIYGLIRCSALEGYTWPSIEFGGDRPLLLFLWCRGSFISVPGTCFYCYKQEKKKTMDERALNISGKGMRNFAYTRLSWVSAQAAQKAEYLEGRRRNLYMIFVFLLILETSKQAYRFLRHITGRMLRSIGLFAD